MEFEYEHINDIEKFKKHVKNYNTSIITQLMPNVLEDNSYSDDEKNQIMDILSAAYEIKEEQEKREKEEREARRKEEERNERNRQRFQAGRERQRQNYEARRNRNVTEYSDDELVTQYDNLKTNIARMESRVNNNRRTSDEYMDNLERMNNAMNEIQAEIEQRGLTIEENHLDEQYEKMSKKQRHEATKQYRNDVIGKMNLEQLLNERTNLESIINDIKSQLNNSELLKPNMEAKYRKELQLHEEQLKDCESYINKREKEERVLKEKAELKEKIEKQKIEKQLAEAEAKRKEEERIAKEKAEAEARRKEEERIAKEKAEAEARRKEEERIAKEKAEAEARRKEEERIAKEKAEIEEKRKVQEKIEKAKQEAIRKKLERMAKEKAEAEAKKKEYIKNQSKILFVRYESYKSPKNEYSFSYLMENEKKVTDELKGSNKNKFSRLSQQLKDDYDIIIGNRDYRKIKYCDPELICILYQTKGIDCANEYLNQLEKGKYADRNKLPYSMVYDLNGIWKNKNLSLREKINITKMARSNKYVAKVKPERKLSKGWIALLTALGIGGTMLALTDQKSKDIDDDIKNKKPTVSDTINKTSLSNKEVNEITTDGKIEKETNSWKLLEETLEKVHAQTDEVINKFNKDEQESKEELQLGSVLKLPEGLKYSESVYGGRKGNVGDQYAPADGVYVVDYVAQIKGNEVSNTYGLDGKIENNLPDSEQFVHIAYVSGANSIEEAKVIIEQQKENAKKNAVDKNVIQPRGWVSKDTIKKVYENQISEYTKVR